MICLLQTCYICEEQSRGGRRRLALACNAIKVAVSSTSMWHGKQPLKVSQLFCMFFSHRFCILKGGKRRTGTQDNGNNGKSIGICYICEENGHAARGNTGCCMKCNKKSCKQYFHVTWYVCEVSHKRFCVELHLVALYFFFHLIKKEFLLWDVRG